MANSIQGKDQGWKKAFRFLIINDKTLEEIFHLRFTKTEAFVLGGLLLFLVAGLTASLFFFTRVKELIPGYPDGNMRRTIVMNAMLLDSLENELRIRDQYFENVRAIVSGEEPASISYTRDTSINLSEISFSRSPDDSLLRQQYEVEEKFSLSLTEPAVADRGIFSMSFIAPVRGLVVNSFNAANDHFGTDIVAGPNEVIKATLDGTVISATWTLETGYVIQLQHDNDLISVYKHNRELLKKDGIKVKAGEAIAIIGNLGELSTGPHLHFELWYKGQPINPEDYIVF